MKRNARAAGWVTGCLAIAFASLGGSASASWTWANDWQIPTGYTWYHLGTAGGTTLNQVDYRFTAPKTGSVTYVAPDIHYVAKAGSTNWTMQFRADNAGNPGTVLATKTGTGASFFGGYTNPETFWLSGWAELNVPITAGSVYHLTISSPDAIYDNNNAGWNDIEPGHFTSTWNGNQRSSDRTQDLNMALLKSTNGGATWTAQNVANGGGFLGGIKYSDGSAYGNGPYTTKTGETQYYVYDTRDNGELFRYTGSSLAESFIENVQIQVRSGGTPPNGLKVNLFDVTANSMVFSGLDVTGVTSSFSWITVAASGLLVPTHDYRLYLSTTGGDTTNYYLPYIQDAGTSTGMNELSFQGTSGLRIVSTDSGGSWSGSSGYDMTFRFTLVPEPASLSLLALGGMALLRRRK